MGQGRVIVISAPSGAGKTTITRQLLTALPGLAHSVSWTTRSPRAGEIDGADYHFVDATAFQKMIDRNGFIEWAEVHGARYGTPREAVEKLLAEGKDVIFDIDVQGGRSMRRSYPQAITIFIMPPSRDVLTERLKGRGTEDEPALKRRLQRAQKEMDARHEYRHVVVNDSIEKACEVIRQIIGAERGPT